MKINFKSQVQNLSGLIIMSVSYYGLIIFLEKEFLHKWYWHLPVILLLIPTLFIHISYLIENYNDEYVISKKHIINKKRNVEYNVNSIYKIIVYKYESLPNGIHFMPFHCYKYCKVILKNGESLILTSLLKYNIDEFMKHAIEGVVFEKKHKYLPDF